MMWGVLYDERTGLSFIIAAGLASAVILGSESRGTRDHILLSQIRDFLFVASFDSQGYGIDIRPRLHTVPRMFPLATDSRYIAWCRTPWKTCVTCHNACSLALYPALGMARTT
jgi:hypothetical protein